MSRTPSGPTRPVSVARRAAAVTLALAATWVGSGAHASASSVAAVPDRAPAAATATGVVPRLPLLAGLGVSVSGPATARVGDLVTFTVTVTNNGPDAAADASMFLTLPSNWIFVAFSQSSGPAASATTPSPGVGGTITASTVSLPAAASQSFSVTMSVGAAPGGTVVTTTAAVSTSTPDAVTTDDSATTDTTILGTADLSLSAVSGGVTAGEPATYTVNVANAGPDTAASTTTVVVALSTGLSFVSGTGTGWTCTATAATVTCERSDDLASGATSTITLVVDVADDATGEATTTFTLSNADDDPTSTDRTATVVDVVTPTTTTTTATDPSAPGTDAPSTSTGSDDGDSSGGGSSGGGATVDTDADPVGATSVPATALPDTGSTVPLWPALVLLLVGGAAVLGSRRRVPHRR